MVPTGLSMLWEPVDAPSALRSRFGFEGVDEVAGWLRQVLGDIWGIAVTTCPRLAISDRHAIVWLDSDRGPLVAKWSSVPGRFPALHRAAALAGEAGQRGIPVAAPLLALDGSVRVVHPGPIGPLSVAVLLEVAGSWLDVDDAAAVYDAGTCLARVQAVLAEHSDDRARPATGGDSLGDRLHEWLTADGDDVTSVTPMAQEARERLRLLAADLPPLPGRTQLVHNDFRAANLLTRDSRVVAVLDFDELSWEHPVHELAKATTYLATRFTDWGPTPVAARRTFLAGYAAVRPLTGDERRWYDALVLWLGLQAVPGTTDPDAWVAVLQDS